MKDNDRTMYSSPEAWEEHQKKQFAPKPMEYEVFENGKFVLKKDNYLEEVNSTYQRFQKQLKQQIAQSAFNVSEELWKI